MEDETKKKRKNKKKKNKQQNQQVKVAAEDTSSNAGETSSQDRNHVDERNNSNQASGFGNGGLGDDRSDNLVEGAGDRSNGTLGSSSADNEKHKWLQEEARLREMVKQLLYEKDLYVQSQVDLESSMKHLQFEIESWHQKEVSLEQRISQLVQEKADVSLEARNLKEKIRHIEKEKFLLVENESSSKELTATLSNENTRLRMQVVELEGAQNSLSQENKQLLENMTAFESRMQDLERCLPASISPVVGQKDGSEEEDLNAQIEAAFTLVEKLVAENAELVEKVNELYMELERRRVPDYISGPDPISGSGEEFSLSSSRSAKQFQTVLIREDRLTSDDLDSDYANVVRQSSETAISGDIIQIPLSENEVQDLEAQTFPVDRDEGDGVPITDAPLIGAPFRLISFVAKYVSGADLVNSSSSDSLLEQ